MSGRVSVVIPAYNGREVLSRCLPSILIEARAGGAREVIVVDDASADDTARWLRAEHSDVRLVRNPVNVGFGASANRGFEEAGGELVLLLNSDMRVREGFIGAMLPHFDDQSVFAVTARTRTGDDAAPDFGFSRGIFRQGELTFLGVRQIDQDGITEAVDTFYAGGGQSLFRRGAFLELGGFDSIYRPFYYEDTDLSYRALKSGMRVVYEPGAVCYHEGQATISRTAKPRRIRVVLERNYYLLSWINVTDRDLAREMIRMAPLNFLKALLTGNLNRVLGFFAALVRIPGVRARRKSRRFSRRDADLLDLSFREIFRY